jgi:hypothetical protein
MIDYTDPAQTTHDDKPIPIDTPAKYLAGEKILKSLYAYYELPWTLAASSAYEQRVRDGQTLREIITNTYDEYLDRTTNVPGT